MDQNAERVNPSSDPAEVGGLAESCHLLAECFSTPSLVFFFRCSEREMSASLCNKSCSNSDGCWLSNFKDVKKKKKQRESCYHTVVLSMMVGMI